jgi:ribonucleoside-diphosphate reductase alpha chain
MTSNKNIPFAKSLIDYIFCWLGCRFIPGYAEKNTPNGAIAAEPSPTNTTAKQLVEKTKDLAKKIDEAKALHKKPAPPAQPNPNPPTAKATKFAEAAADRVVEMVGAVIAGDTQLQTEAATMHKFSQQFQRFQDDAPACDVCGSITVRNGMCYRCYNCGNSMGCS